MVSEKALKKMRILVFWEKHGLEATQEAFQVKRRTLFDWKQRFQEGGMKIEALNDHSRAPKRKRVREWDERIIAEIKRLRFEHPNLGKDKIYPELLAYCTEHALACPTISTIGRIIKDLRGLRMFPQKVSHFGKIKTWKRAKKLRKPKDFKTAYPGHLVSLDSIERRIHGSKRYIITFEDIHTRFTFAWSTTSHASPAAKEFFDLCLQVFPFPITFVLTDNGSEFAKEFSKSMKELHLTHYHTYPRTPKMNAHIERFNRTIQEEFVDFHVFDLLTPPVFNNKLIDYLIWYNTKRVHHAFKNKLSPVQFMLSLDPVILNIPQECKDGWTRTHPCHFSNGALYLFYEATSLLFSIAITSYVTGKSDQARFSRR
ncbi:MAG TPA: DDE-type integrase/transposase/recombinase [Patescibacteria group bacterium]|nr:DDE-type integrase/transposase/recombinase [Patescibacteria group bacterium]